MHCGDEVQAFKCFANAMNREILHNFYLFDMKKVNILFHVYTRLLEEKVAKLSVMFNELEIQCSLFLFEWIITIFSNIFSLQVSARIWDSYLHYGDYYLMKVCLGVSMCIEKIAT